MSEETPERAPKSNTTWRWVLLVVAIIAAGYSLYYAGGITQSMNSASSTAVAPVVDLQTVPVCPVPAQLTLPDRVDVRFQVETSGSILVSRRLTGEQDADGLRIPGLRANGTGTVRLSDGTYAGFTYADGVCTPLELLPPEPDGDTEVASP